METDNELKVFDRRETDDIDIREFVKKMIGDTVRYVICVSGADDDIKCAHVSVHISETEKGRDLKIHDLAGIRTLMFRDEKRLATISWILDMML